MPKPADSFGARVTVDDIANLPIPWQRSPGDIFISTAGNAFVNEVVAGVQSWLPFGGGGGGSTFGGLLYVVDNNPVLAPFPVPAPGVRGPFQTIADAITQIGIDAPGRATIMVVRGVYNEAVSLPRNVSLTGLPGVASQAALITGSVSVPGATADGFTGLSFLRIEANGAPAVSFTGAHIRELRFNNLDLRRSDAGVVLDLSNTNPTTALIAENLSVLALTEATPAVALSCPMQWLGGSLFGTVNAAPGGDLQTRDVSIRGDVVLDDAVAALTNTSVLGTGDVGGAIRLLNGSDCDLDDTSVENGGQPITIGGAGTVRLLSAQAMRVRGIEATLSVQTRPSGRAQDGQVITPGGPGTLQIDAGADFVELDCTATAAGAVVLELPDARLMPPYKPLTICRIDSNVAVTVTVACVAPNEFNRTVPAVTVLTLGVSDNLSLTASRSAPGRWLRTP